MQEAENGSHPSDAPCSLRAVARGRGRGEPGGEAELGPLRGFPAVLRRLWPTGGVPTVRYQHGQRPSGVDELAAASV